MPVSRRVLRQLVMLAVVLSLLALPGTVAADRPFAYSDRSVGFWCSFEDENTVTFTGAWHNEEWGASAWIDIYAHISEDPWEEESLLFGFTEDVAVTDDGTTVTFVATIPLYEPGTDPEAPSDPIGTAELSATLVPDGPPIVLTPHRQGNRWVRTEGYFQPMTVTGSLTLPGDVTYDLGAGGCAGERWNVDVWETNPRAFVDRSAAIFASCFWETDSGFAAFYAEVGDFGAYADALLLDIDPDTGEPISGLAPDYDAPTNVTFTTSSLSATIPMVTVPDEVPAGSAVASASVSAAGPTETFTIVSQNFRERIKGTPLTLDGWISFPTGEAFAFADASCFAVDFTTHFKSNPAQGPKPGGKAPANDDPSGALALKSRGKLNVQTGGAAWEPEVEASCAPIGTTVWYRIEGTGGPITVDTAGSSFDTVAAVYVTDGGAWEEIACVDDVSVGSVGYSYQSAVTWDSELGTTYYVQLGGFSGEFGRLRVAVH